MKHYVKENLRFYRLHHRYTQQDIAKQLKATLGQVKSYETGYAVPPIEILVRIADMIGISLDTLIRVKLSAKNFLEQKTEAKTSLLSRLESLENTVNKIVNKKPKKGDKKTNAKTSGR